MTNEELLTIALKNKLIELNSHVLYETLLDNLITEEQFEKEIRNNYDKYIVSQDIMPGKEDIIKAMDIFCVLPQIFTTRNFCEMFSFNGKRVRELLTSDRKLNAKFLNIIL